MPARKVNYLLICNIYNLVLCLRILTQRILLCLFVFFFCFAFFVAILGNFLFPLCHFGISGDLCYCVWVIFHSFVQSLFRCGFSTSMIYLRPFRFTYWDFWPATVYMRARSNLHFLMCAVVMGVLSDSDVILIVVVDDGFIL